MREKRKSIHQFLSVFLSFLLTFSLLLPTTALAVEGNGSNIDAVSEEELVKKLEAEYAVESDKLTESEEVKDNPSLLSGVDWSPSLEEGDAPSKQDPSLPKVEGTVNEELKNSQSVNVIIHLKDKEGSSGGQRKLNSKIKEA